MHNRLQEHQRRNAVLPVNDTPSTTSEKENQEVQLAPTYQYTRSEKAGPFNLHHQPAQRWSMRRSTMLPITRMRRSRALPPTQWKWFECDDSMKCHLTTCSNNWRELKWKLVVADILVHCIKPWSLAHLHLATAGGTVGKLTETLFIGFGHVKKKEV